MKELTDSQRATLDVVRTGGRSGIRTADVARALGLEPRPTYTRLSKLADAGLIQKGGPGRHAKVSDKGSKWRVREDGDAAGK